MIRPPNMLTMPVHRQPLMGRPHDETPMAPVLAVPMEALRDYAEAGGQIMPEPGDQVQFTVAGKFKMAQGDVALVELATANDIPITGLDAKPMMEEDDYANTR